MDPFQFLVEWNSEYPFDFWWRSKYKVPFNSPSHRNISYQDMFFDFIENSFFEKVRKGVQNRESEELEYVPGKRNFLKPQKTEDELFEELDLDNFKL